MTSASLAGGSGIVLSSPLTWLAKAWRRRSSRSAFLPLLGWSREANLAFSSATVSWAGGSSFGGSGAQWLLNFCTKSPAGAQISLASAVCSISAVGFALQSRVLALWRSSKWGDNENKHFSVRSKVFASRYLSVVRQEWDQEKPAFAALRVKAYLVRCGSFVSLRSGRGKLGACHQWLAGSASIHRPGCHVPNFYFAVTLSA